MELGAAGQYFSLSIIKGNAIGKASMQVSNNPFWSRF
jgi:hypothetical protein